MKKLLVGVFGTLLAVGAITVRPPTAVADDSIKWYSPWRDTGCAHLCSSQQPHCKCQGLPDIIVEM